jgi:hypothetical protein
MIDWLRWFNNRVNRPVLLLMDNFGILTPKKALVFWIYNVILSKAT